MRAASLLGPSLLQSAMGTQFNVVAVARRWQLVLDLINAGIKPGLPHKCLPLGHHAGQEQNPYS